MSLINIIHIIDIFHNHHTLWGAIVVVLEVFSMISFDVLKCVFINVCFNTLFTLCFASTVLHFSPLV